MAEFVRAYPPAQPEPGPARWFIFQGQNLLLVPGEAGVALPQGDVAELSALEPQGFLYLGTLDGSACMAATVEAETVLPAGMTPVGLRALFGRVSGEEFAIAGYASQLLYWQRASRFCALCGSPTGPVVGEWAKRCSGCAHTAYPHVSPCVIVLIHDGDQVLLSHKPGWSAMHSILAGFVEPGESLEECLVREVREEVGIEVDDLRYFGSQPWPYPHQLMVGFFARYRSGEIVIDATELDSAAWFHVDSLPQIPPRLSIARQMIDAWVASRRT